ncbi:glycine oxidase ThiO [Rhodococcoides trifolii]|nr:glycine oxidase ThiO [Rhodococcus trifolii]
MKSVTVVGAGVIGLSIAWRAARSGWAVRIADPAIGRGASHVAGGMLAPLSEGWPGEDGPLEFGAESLRRWPTFVSDLGADGLITARGALTVAFDAADAEDLRTVAEFVTARGHEMEIVSRRDVKSLEPAVSHNVRLGLLAPAELAVDNRRVVAALMTAAVSAGVDLTEDRVDDVSALGSDQVVLAAGWATARLCPSVPVRPVKGEILRLRARSGSPAGPTRTVRASVNGRSVYLVPRVDGLVVGATQYEHGDDTTVTVGGVRDLLADAERVFPGVADYEFSEAAAGLRPMSPDNVPLIGRVDARTVVATGHGRNGMLLAPLTADAVLAELDGSALPEATSASLERFSS